MKNIMSVDLEDYYCDLTFSEWEKYEDRVEENTKEILELFDKYNVKATFFTVGYIAEKFPLLIKDIQDRGHEIGTHSYAHIDLRKVTKEDFEKDLIKSIKIIESITNEKVFGFRAPFFSVTKDRNWIYDILRKYVAYDSSVFPVKTNLYGIPDAPRDIYHPSKKLITEKDENEEFIELPPLTLRLFGINIPMGGGFYFRFFPYFLLKYAIKKFNKKNKPAIFYLHPKDLDPKMQKIKQYSWHYYYGKKKT